MIPINLLWADAKRFWFGILTLILLIASATALSTLVNLQERALRIGSARAAESFDIIIGAPGSETQLVLSSVFLQPSSIPLLSSHYLDELNNDPAVAWSAPLAFGDTYKGMPIVGTRSEMVTYNNQRNLAQGHTFQSEFDAVVGSATDLKLGDTFTPVHGQIQRHDEHRYTVVGILPQQNNHWDKAILVPIEAIWNIHGLGHQSQDSHDQSAHKDHGEPNISAIVVKPSSIAAAYQIRAQYRTSETLAVFPAEVLTSLYTTLGDIHHLLTIISSATQLLLGISIALVTIVHLNQRKIQFAALRAFGAPRYAIVSLIWLGLIMLISIGIVIGITTGYLIAQEISNSISAKTGFTMPVYLTLHDGKNMLILLFIASIFSLIPALSTYRISAAQALRL